MKNKDEMLENLAVLTDESISYQTRLDAYEYLQDGCEEIVDEMLEKFSSAEGEISDMLIEILTEYKGDKRVFNGLVANFYKAYDIAGYARLLGKYGDEDAIEILNGYAKENELNYNEFIEIRNAVEELGGDFVGAEKDFEDDEYYRLIKGLDEPDEESRRSPFEDMFKQPKESDEDEEE